MVSRLTATESSIVSNALNVLAQEGFHFSSEVSIMYFGGAANNLVAQSLAGKMGANFVGGFSHEFDLVGNVIGMNTLNPVRIIGSILAAPTLPFSSISPHSNYLFSQMK